MTASTGSLYNCQKLSKFRQSLAPPKIIPTIGAISGLARFLEQLGGKRGLPQTIVCDNGLELTSKALFFWARRQQVRLQFIQPGKSTQNAFVESFNGKFREGCLDQQWF